MGKKSSPRVKIMDFNFASASDICAELGRRLKMERLLQRIKQTDLAGRAGISVGTMKTMESCGRTSLENVVKVAYALGLTPSLANLFQERSRSLADLVKLEELSSKPSPSRVR